eukprot:363900-Chlamydomonas_euryale.AAC.1
MAQEAARRWLCGRCGAQGCWYASHKSLHKVVGLPDDVAYDGELAVLDVPSAYSDKAVARGYE